MPSSLTEKGDEKKHSFFVRCLGHIDALIVPFYWDAFDHRKFCISIKKPCFKKKNKTKNQVFFLD